MCYNFLTCNRISHAPTYPQIFFYSKMKIDVEPVSCVVSTWGWDIYLYDVVLLPTSSSSVLEVRGFLVYMWARSTQDSITIVIRGASVIGFSVCPFRIFYLDFQMSISQLFKELQRLKFRNLNLSSPNILLEPILELWWPSWIFVI